MMPHAAVAAHGDGTHAAVAAHGDGTHAAVAAHPNDLADGNHHVPAEGHTTIGEEWGSAVSEESTDYDDCVEEIESHICEMKELAILADEWAMTVEESKDQTLLHQHLKAWIVRLEIQIGTAEDFMRDKKSLRVSDKFREELAIYMSDVILP